MPILNDLSGSKRVVEHWTRNDKPTEVLDDVTARLVSCGATIAHETADAVEFKRGSRARYRTLGFLTPVRQIPIAGQVDICSSQSEGVLITAQVWSDEGRYARDNRLNRALFRRASRQLLGVLEPRGAR